MNIPLFPESASTFAPEVDALFAVLVAFSAGLGTLLVVLILYYAIRYRRGSPAPRVGRRARNLWLEAAWTSATLVVAFGLFAWGAHLYAERETPPANALHIVAIGKQWMWKFQHPDGQREINILHVPVGRPVLVELASQDVIHSLYIPAFRVKQDAVPGMTTNVWFEATRTGSFHLFCAEFCGTEHSAMQGRLVALSPEDYARWLDEQPPSDSPVAAGGMLYRALGCSGCHEPGGTIRAPDLHGVYGRPVALASATTVFADTRYIRDSILMPRKEIAAGYAPVMPSFDGLLDEDELMQLVAYIRSLSDAEAAAP
jgi:cytochrome c oxidase subunit 2